MTSRIMEIGRQALTTLTRFLGVLTLLLVESQAAGAAIITVNTTDDELNSNSVCSLREAIQAANTDTAVDTCTAGSGADTIVVPAGIYTLTLGIELAIDSDLTLTGAAADNTIIQAATEPSVVSFRVFTIIGGIVTISGVTVRHGAIVGSGGGIFNRFRHTGNLTLTESVVTANEAIGFFGGGGGILNDQTMTIANSTVSGNTAGHGGGIFQRAGTMLIMSSTIRDNSATSSSLGGGGIRNSNNFPIPTMTIISSTISGNTSSGAGGGIRNSGQLTLANTTISGNTSRSAQGAGISVANQAALITLRNSTISQNTGGGIWNPLGGLVELANTIIASNPPGADCLASGPTSFGHNLDGDGTCGLGAAGDLSNANPFLAPLQDNGGSTFTHALLPSSPAIDAGNPATPGSGGNACEATDQRGVTRPQGAACDIGAFELDRAIKVVIDIKPGSEPNCFNINGHGVIPVAILGSADLNVSDINVQSLLFDGLELRVRGNKGPFCSIEDSNADAFPDLVCQFEDDPTNWSGGGTTASVTGELNDGTPIQGTDSICIVP